ncbi:MAG: UDP-N-acetylenolpyruvoylglucosamine reductase, partial [Oscillospiraceae bacterium]|nr:UDP-N-acetylenolpyruvoylglucosamine reductase [Oscillospiraceae bacterium]
MEKAIMINKLKAMGLNLIEDADMSRYTSFRAGGHAAALVEVETKDELKAVLQFVNKENIPHI